MEVRLLSCEGEQEAINIINILKENGIAAYMRDSGAGNLMNIEMGFSVFGKDILVDEKDVVAARLLLKGYHNTAMHPTPSLGPGKRRIVFFFTILFIISIIAGLVLSFMQ